MSTQTFAINKKTTLNEKGISEKNNFNRIALYQSNEAKKIYAEILKQSEGSITISYDDIDGKLINAIGTLSPNEKQVEIMQRFHSALKCIETTIDPNRLRFAISKATDDEIYYYRKSLNGISKIIIHDDGLIASSFISFKGIPKKDDLTFYEDESKIDYEQLAYCFLAL